MSSQATRTAGMPWRLRVYPQPGDIVNKEVPDGVKIEGRADNVAGVSLTIAESA